MWQSQKVNKSKTLFICMTPFQIYFASKIIENEKLGNSAAIFLIDLTDNAKNLRYLLQAKEKYSCEVYRYEAAGNTKLIKLLNFLVFYFIHFLTKKFEDVFIASLHDKYIHIFIKLLRFKNLKSFDDGAANINKSGMFFHNEYVVFKIRPKIVEHYTIYRGIGNVVSESKVKYIELFNFDNKVIGSVFDKVIFFIGQPYDEFFEGFNKPQFEKKLMKLGVDFYIKHPRENMELFSIPSIEIDDIFELYLDGFIRNNPNKSIKVYSYFSSVMFNLSGAKDIELICLKNNELYEKYKFLYDLMSELEISVCDDGLLC